MEIDLLNDVNENEYFRVNDGTILKNLNDLLESLKTMPSEIFHSHVTEDRNDFANWVRNSVGDRVLADRLEGTKKQDQMYRLVQRRIEELTPKPEKPKEEPAEKEEEKPKAETQEAKPTPSPTKSVTENVKALMESKDIRGEFVDFLLGLVIGFIIGLIIKTLI